VWERAELEAVAEFARRHDLLLISDEIHHDLVFPGSQHTSMATLDGILDRLIMVTAASKTFSLAGLRVGNVIIQDPDLRARFAARMKSLKQPISVLDMAMVRAAQSPEGGAWTDALVPYLDGNRRTFQEGLEAIPGLRMTPMEGTFLAWVDFSETGITREEFTARVERGAGIAASHGNTFGPGGENFLRFNIGTQRARIAEAIDRLSRAFADAG
jgi:cystathionine beta-lyase